MSLADVCVFVVDSTKDIESSRFQHIATFAKHFGVQQLVVAISRMDSHLNPMERYNLLKDSVLQGLQKAGFAEASILGVVPTTSVNDGANIMSNKRYFDWYTGEAVYELLELAKPRVRLSCFIFPFSRLKMLTDQL
jgi:translation elongation factor EF-1alpha